jgi:alkylated DNA nucleotide flippase Atl1
MLGRVYDCIRQIGNGRIHDQYKKVSIFGGRSKVPRLSAKVGRNSTQLQKATIFSTV